MPSPAPDFTLNDLIDLALCLPEVGAVNFNILRVVLLELVRQLGGENIHPQLDDVTAHQIQNFKNYIQGAGTSSPMPGVLRYNTPGYQYATKTPRAARRPLEKAEATISGTPPPVAASPPGTVGADMSSASVGLLQPGGNLKSGDTGTKVIGPHPPVAQPAPNAMSAKIPPTAQYKELENKVARLERHMEALYALPTNSTILHTSEAAEKPEGMSVNDMWQIIQLNNRVAAAEAAIQKMASLIEDLAKGLNTLKHANEGAAATGAGAGKAQGQGSQPGGSAHGEVSGGKGAGGGKSAGTSGGQGKGGPAKGGQAATGGGGQGVVGPEALESLKAEYESEKEQLNTMKNELDNAMQQLREEMNNLREGGQQAGGGAQSQGQGQRQAQSGAVQGQAGAQAAEQQQPPNQQQQGGAGPGAGQQVGGAGTQGKSGGQLQAGAEGQPGPGSQPSQKGMIGQKGPSDGISAEETQNILASLDNLRKDFDSQREQIGLLADAIQQPAISAGATGEAGGQPAGSATPSDMRQIIQLTNRVNAMEAAVQKMAGLIDDWAKGLGAMKGVKPTANPTDRVRPPAKEPKSLKKSAAAAAAETPTVPGGAPAAGTVPPSAAEMQLPAAIPQCEEVKEAVNTLKEELDNIRQQWKWEMNNFQQATMQALAKPHQSGAEFAQSQAPQDGARGQEPQAGGARGQSQAQAGQGAAGQQGGGWQRQQRGGGREGYRPGYSESQASAGTIKSKPPRARREMQPVAEKKGHGPEVLPEDLQTIFTNLNNLLTLSDEQQDRIEQLYEVIEQLHSMIVTKPMLIDAMAEKAGKDEMNTKVSYDEFGDAIDELVQKLQNLLVEVYQKNEGWKRITDKLIEEMGDKLDKYEIGPLRAYFKSHLGDLEAQVAALVKQFNQPDPAGTRKKLLKDYNCISCDRHCAISGITNTPLLPCLGASMPGPTGQTNASHRAYDLYNLRNAKKGDQGCDMNAIERSCDRFSRVSTSQVQSLRGSAVSHLVNRYVGGSHTAISNADRIAALSKRPSTAHPARPSTSGQVLPPAPGPTASNPVLPAQSGAAVPAPEGGSGEPAPAAAPEGENGEAQHASATRLSVAVAVAADRPQTVVPAGWAMPMQDMEEE